VNTVMNLRVPQNVGKFLSNCTTGEFSRRAQLHKVKLVRSNVYVKPVHTDKKWRAHNLNVKRFPGVKPDTTKQPQITLNA
jgi:hypothetical protein